MVQHDEKDYFVNEPALANVDNFAGYSPVLPTRWFMRDGKVWSKALRLISHPSEDSLIIDLRSGVCEEIPLEAYFASFEEVKTNHRYHGLADPSRITGTNFVTPGIYPFDIVQ